MNKIEIDNKGISDEEALKQKDFDKVLNQARSVNGSKESKLVRLKRNAVVGGLAALVVLVAYAVINVGDANPKSELIQAQVGKSNASYDAKYNSPTNEDVKFVNLLAVVKSNEVLIVQTESGTKITIPANTLMDGNGKKITGNIVLKYREFLDQKDIFQSGIPMLYKDGTEERVFESGGMFELLVYQNDEPIYIAPQKQVQVDLASKQVGDNFNVYYYSPDDSSWINKGRDNQGFSTAEQELVDSILSTTEVYAEIVQFKKESQSTELALMETQQSKPMAPVVATESKPSFVIDVNYKHFPELQAMHGVKFQVSDKETKFKPVYASETWSSAVISRGNERNEFITCFKNEKHGEKCFLTNPVIGKENLDAANEQYDVLMEAYLFKKDSTVKRMALLKEKLAKRIQKLNQNRIIELNSRSVDLSQVVENRVTRTFQIGNFGIWNSDCPQKLPQEAIVKAKFVDEAGTPLMFNRMYLVLKGKNIVITLYPEVFRKGIPHNPNDDCMLWAVTPDLKNVAVFNTSQFKAINKSDKTHTFNMRLVSSKVFDKYTLDAIFNI